jgi:hypothetical protein
MNNTIKDYLKTIGKRGGQATKQKHDKDYCKRLGRQPMIAIATSPDSTRQKRGIRSLNFDGMNIASA